MATQQQPNQQNGDDNNGLAIQIGKFSCSLRKCLGLTIQLATLFGIIFAGCRYLISTRDIAQQALDRANQAAAQKADEKDFDELRNDISDLRKELRDYELRQQRRH